MHMRQKPLFLLTVFLIVLTALPAVAMAQGGLRYTIGVESFQNQANWEGQFDFGHAWGVVMTDLLNRNPNFIVVGQADMRAAALEEQDLTASGRATSGEGTPTTGDLTSAQLLVKGAITHYQEDTGGGNTGINLGRIRLGGKSRTAQISATIYLVDTRTGQVVASTSLHQKSKQRGGSVQFNDGNVAGSIGGFKNSNMQKVVEEAVAQAIGWLEQQLPRVPWRAQVVLVEGDKVYINRGAREGVALGQEFTVGEVKVIKDPTTGEILDESLDEVASLRAEQVRNKVTICSVASGDTVDLYPEMNVRAR